ncbi:DUF5791 family protein [Halobacteriales archaeon Cl-PHB]
MLRGEFESAGETSPAELQAAYEQLLATTVDRVGVDTVVEESGVDRATVAALADGESPTLDLEDATAILATDEDRPDAEAIAAEARDILLMGMTTAVVDVDTLASEIDGALEPKEIQQKVEGRYPMTLEEYALLHHELESQAR